MKIPALVVALACSLATMTAQTGPTLPSPGINFGNMLEAPKEGAWGLTLKDEYFGIAAKAGFKTIRIPIRWSVRTSPKPPYAIDPAFLARVDRAVAGAKREGLTAILDLHNYTELEENPDANAARFIAIWKQIAEHYRDEPPSIVFELCNEPSKKLDAGRWNILIAGTLAAIRPSNPDRTVIVGPVGWNSIGKLPDLVLPENDRNLLVTVHYYDPFHFTHQKASWVEGSDAWAGTRWTGTDAEKAAVAADFAKAAAWGKEHGRPLFVGEFGAYGEAGTPMEDRAAWTACVARTLDGLGIPWAYWEFGSGFGAYDPKANAWRDPLLKALIGP